MTITCDTETKARINGVQAQIMEFSFIVLGESICGIQTCSIKHSTLSAAEGQEVAPMTISTSESIRDDASFVAFWQKVNAPNNRFDIEELTLYPGCIEPPLGLKMAYHL